MALDNRAKTRHYCHFYQGAGQAAVSLGIHDCTFFGKYLQAAVFLKNAKMGRRLFFQLSQAAELTFTRQDKPVIGFGYTVIPVYNDHSWDPKTLAVVDRWSLFTGHLCNISYI
jgi:hypothetical protein